MNAHKPAAVAISKWQARLDAQNEIRRVGGRKWLVDQTAKTSAGKPSSTAPRGEIRAG